MKKYGAKKHTQLTGYSRYKKKTPDMLKKMKGHLHIEIGEALAWLKSFYVSLFYRFLPVLKGPEKKKSIKSSFDLYPLPLVILFF